VNERIHPKLDPLIVPISALRYLEPNPRKGNVLAIKASLEQFGQLKPIVTRLNEDGSATVLTGNHTLKAAVLLGWEYIAAVVDESMDDAHASAFSLVDNRVNELGSVDSEILYDALIDVVEVMPEMFDAVGWDDFEIASIAVGVENDDGTVATGQAGGYVAPEFVGRTGEPTVKPTLDSTDPESPRLVAPSGTDERAAIVAGVGGAISQNPNAKKAAVQYTLAFDDADQMGRWWEFVRFLRSSEVYVGETIAERLMDFIEAHGDF
jgi:hypothetical protein